ncbi:MAG: hypothetical protein JSW66_08125, partial [Phycisphaerales bacterium]
ALIPTLNEEERVAKRRKRIWSEGSVVDGVIEAKNRSWIGRKEIRYRYVVNGEEYFDERVITHVDDFDPLEVGGPITLHFDPKEPQFSVTAQDVAPSFVDWIPGELVIGIIFVASGLMALWGFHRRRVLRNGIEVPCTNQQTSLPNLVRVSYEWYHVTRNRLVEGKCMSEGEPGAVLLDPAFPAWPILGMHDRFSTNDDPVSFSTHDFRRRWATAIVPGTIVVWMVWGLLSLMIGEWMSPYLRTAFILVVGIVITWLGGRQDSDSPGQADSASEGSEEESG